MSQNQKSLDNHANQLNANNAAYYSSRGISGGRPDNWSTNTSYSKSRNPSTQSDLNNHSNQLNPNNFEYHHSRGSDKKSK